MGNFKITANVLKQKPFLNPISDSVQTHMLYIYLETNSTISILREGMA